MSETLPNKLFCYNHPDRETLLRCNRCERPICSECAVLTPTGYRCKACVRSQQKTFETTTWLDYPLAIGIAGVLSFLGSYLAALLGFFTIFIAPIAGVLVAEAVRWAVRRRRSRLLFQLTAAAAAIGSLPLQLIHLFVILLVSSSGSGAGFGVFLPLLWRGLYTFLVTSTVYYRLAGIRVR